MYKLTEEEEKRLYEVARSKYTGELAYNFMYEGYCEEIKENVHKYYNINYKGYVDLLIRILDDRGDEVKKNDIGIKKVVDCIIDEQQEVEMMYRPLEDQEYIVHSCIKMLAINTIINKEAMIY